MVVVMVMVVVVVLCGNGGVCVCGYRTSNNTREADLRSRRQAAYNDNNTR
jgi:hypothetical protein